MRIFPVLPTALLLSMGTATFAAAQTPAVFSTHDVDVLAHVHAVDRTEIRLAKLAQERGSVDVKEYAAHLVVDHGKVDKDVLTLARKHDAALPAEPTDAAEVAMANVSTGMEVMLETLSGPDFDHAYLQLMVRGHDAEVQRIDAAIVGAPDPTIVTLLQDLKPTVEAHADEAKRLLAGEKH